ncbi:12327_t:CDS:1, partial [Dentiscutata heterogama]
GTHQTKVSQPQCSYFLCLQIAFESGLELLPKLLQDYLVMFLGFGFVVLLYSEPLCEKAASKS